MIRIRVIPTLACSLALGLCWCAPGVQAAAPTESWDVDPYQIHVSLAIDAPADLTDELAGVLPQYLRERAAVSIGAAWRLETELATGAERRAMLADIDSIKASQLPAAASGEDKRLLVTIVATPWGYLLAAREYDRYLERWGPTRRATTRQRDALAEQVFDLVRQTVAPLAHFRPDPEHKERVLMEIRGAGIPIAGPDFAWVAPGDVFLPVIRRTNRDGQLAGNGVQKMPWTYLEVTGVAGPQVVARLESGTRRSLGTRRGRFEEVAIALRADPGDTVVRLHSRTQKDKPLVGYEIGVKNTSDESTTVAGTSNEDGEVTIHPGKSAIQLLYAKCGGELLARLPIVPGADDHVIVPLPDVDVRLQAEARLADLREDLVDLVARRNIFIARVKALIENKEYDKARQLLESLDELPGRSQFNQALEKESRLHHSNDPQVQKRIDQLFSATQTVLGQYLDPRPIGELHDELREAKSQNKGS